MGRISGRGTTGWEWGRQKYQVRGANNQLNRTQCDCNGKTDSRVGTVDCYNANKFQMKRGYPDSAQQESTQQGRVVMALGHHGEGLTHTI